MFIEFDMLDAPIDWYIALGSNQGDSLTHLRKARHDLSELGEVLGASAIFRSAPMYETDQPSFLNAVIHLRSTLSGEALLDALRAIERAHGRSRDPERRYGPRSLDLDIVAGVRSDEEIVYSTEQLQIPHERMHERLFVLLPLREIAPDWIHPRLAYSVKEMIDNLPKDDSLVVAYEPLEWV